MLFRSLRARKRPRRAEGTWKLQNDLESSYIDKEEHHVAAVTPWPAVNRSVEASQLIFFAPLYKCKILHLLISNCSKVLKNQAQSTPPSSSGDAVRGDARCAMLSAFTASSQPQNWILVRGKDVMNLAPETRLFLAAFPVSSLQPHLQYGIGFSPSLFTGAG